MGVDQNEPLLKYLKIQQCLLKRIVVLANKIIRPYLKYEASPSGIVYGVTMTQSPKISLGRRESNSRFDAGQWLLHFNRAQPE